MKTLGLSLLILFSFLASAQEASPVGNLAAASQLAAILEQTRTLRADVDVLTLDQDGREIQESTALLVIQKPDHFYWEILSPYSETMLTNGERIWRFEPDLEQVTVEYFNNEINQTPVMLLNGEVADIDESFTISSADMDAGALARFILYPKANDSLFTRLSLTFSGKTIQEMQFEDSLGQKTSLTFSGLQANTTIDPATFEFHMPKDVEIIDNTQ
jgi:outer membrane lipoprotein carrier protein